MMETKYLYLVSLPENIDIFQPAGTIDMVVCAPNETVAQELHPQGGRWHKTTQKVCVVDDQLNFVLDEKGKLSELNPYDREWIVYIPQLTVKLLGVADDSLEYGYITGYVHSS